MVETSAIPASMFWTAACGFAGGMLIMMALHVIAVKVRRVHSAFHEICATIRSYALRTQAVFDTLLVDGVQRMCTSAGCSSGGCARHSWTPLCVRPQQQQRPSASPSSVEEGVGSWDAQQQPRQQTQADAGHEHALRKLVPVAAGLCTLLVPYVPMIAHWVGQRLGALGPRDSPDDHRARAAESMWPRSCSTHGVQWPPSPHAHSPLQTAPGPAGVTRASCSHAHHIDHHHHHHYTAYTGNTPPLRPPCATAHPQSAAASPPPSAGSDPLREMHSMHDIQHREGRESQSNESDGPWAWHKRGPQPRGSLDGAVSEDDQKMALGAADMNVIAVLDTLLRCLRRHMPASAVPRGDAGPTCPQPRQGGQRHAADDGAWWPASQAGPSVASARPAASAAFVPAPHYRDPTARAQDQSCSAQRNCASTSAAGVAAAKRARTEE